jgi:hypothetical protein
MGASKRPEMANQQLKLIPGPGVYESPSKVGEGPKYHFGTRSNLSLNKMEVPGPGTYAP